MQPTEFSAKSRDGKLAKFQRVQPGNEVTNECIGFGHLVFVNPPFVLEGHFLKQSGEVEPELWTAQGRWRSDGSEHPNDLILK